MDKQAFIAKAWWDNLSPATRKNLTQPTNSEVLGIGDIYAIWKDNVVLPWWETLSDEQRQQLHEKYGYVAAIDTVEKATMFIKEQLPEDTDLGIDYMPINWNQVLPPNIAIACKNYGKLGFDIEHEEFFKDGIRYVFAGSTTCPQGYAFALEYAPASMEPRKEQVIIEQQHQDETVTLEESHASLLAIVREYEKHMQVFAERDLLNDTGIGFHQQITHTIAEAEMIVHSKNIAK